MSEDQTDESKSWFKKDRAITGGVAGCVIGVTDVDKALKLYRDVLGYSEVVYDGQKQYADFNGIPGGEEQFRRVILRSNKNRRGAFCRLLNNGLAQGTSPHTGAASGMSPEPISLPPRCG